MAGILVVGGSGFIGTHVAHRLRKAGQDATVFDIKPPSLEGLAPFIKGDVFDPASLAAGVRDCDVVIDLVGLADVGVCQTQPEQSFRLNVESLAHLLEACRGAHVRKIVFPSSAAIYGKVETVPIDETQPLNPSTVYAWHKWASELLIKAYRQSYGLGYVVLRLFNVLGEGNKGVIHHYVRAALERRVIDGFGKDQLRDFVDASDVADAFLLAATQPDVVDKTINIGSGQGVKIGEVAAMVQEAVPGSKVQFSEKEDFIPYHSVADITLARKLLNFRPKPARAVVRDLVRELVRSGG